MSLGTIAIDASIAIATIVDLLCVVALFVMRTPMQRLHFVSPATCVAPVFAAIAIFAGTHATPSQAAKGIVIAAILAAFAGVLSSETGRAIVSRESHRE